MGAGGNQARKTKGSDSFSSAKSKAAVAKTEANAAKEVGPGKLGVGDDYAAHVSGSDGVLASLGEGGILDLYIKAGTTTPRGGQMFNEALSAFGSNVKGVRGTWIGGGDLASNFDSFKAAVAGGSTPAQAAFQTFTGKMSQKAGFTNVKVISNEAKKVVVEFYR